LILKVIDPDIKLVSNVKVTQPGSVTVAPKISISQLVAEMVSFEVGEVIAPL
jgi:hypothetical protein